MPRQAHCALRDDVRGEYPSWIGTTELNTEISILSQTWRIGQANQLAMVPSRADRMRSRTFRLASNFVALTDR